MLKASLFDIKTKKNQQIEDEISMPENERLYLTLDLMELASELSGKKEIHHDDNIHWITLRFVNAKSNS